MYPSIARKTAFLLKHVQRITQYVDTPSGYFGLSSARLHGRIVNAIPACLPAGYVATDLTPMRPDQVATSRRCRREIRRITGSFNDHTYGVVVNSQTSRSLNHYVACMNRIMITDRHARFYISTNSEAVLLAFCVMFRWQLNIYVLRNRYSGFLDDREKRLVDINCLSITRAIVGTADEPYLNDSAVIGNVERITPGSESVFLFDCKPIINVA